MWFLKTSNLLGLRNCQSWSFVKSLAAPDPAGSLGEAGEGGKTPPPSWSNLFHTKAFQSCHLWIPLWNSLRNSSVILLKLTSLTLTAGDQGMDLLYGRLPTVSSAGTVPMYLKDALCVLYLLYCKAYTKKKVWPIQAVNPDSRMLKSKTTLYSKT